ncbi:30173_t:CDS:2 [Racocetra persica]|uniref:30173_t:CDS:1 n=1 Tax=Racocetra persica TaxID=160502 RepID=A0ACA9P9D3_9GLOM|nr:30173_t:CDS:2 [Racocetra persica]
MSESLTLTQLQEEINSLEDRLTQVRQNKKCVSTNTNFIEHLINVNDQSLLSAKPCKSVDHNIDQAINQIAQLRSYTKVHFTHVTNHVKMSSTGEYIRHYIMAGDSRGLDFNLEFDVIESDLRTQILKIKVDPYVRREIGHFVENMEKDANLLTFLKEFVEYARLNGQRELLFNTMKQKVSFLTVNACANYLLKFSDPNDRFELESLELKKFLIYVSVIFTLAIF